MAIIVGGAAAEMLTGDPVLVPEDDIIFGNGGFDFIDGLAGDDFLFGGIGDDTIFGGVGDDWVEGGAGADRMDGFPGIDTLSYAQSPGGVMASLFAGTGAGFDAAGDVFVGFENLVGSGFPDELIGDDFANEIVGGAGDDSIRALDGDDTVEGGAGADRMDGGAGIDTLVYRTSPAGVAVNLAGFGAGGDAAGDVFGGFENLIGSSFDDDLTGDAGANLIEGGVGDDTITALGGDDTVEGGAGADDMLGGPGIDLLSYAGASSSVVVSLGLGMGALGDAAGDMFGGFENLLGSAFDDTLEGSPLDNEILGGSGRDSLIGFLGDDTLVGGAGRDTLAGAGGDDVFLYRSIDDSPANGRDRINGFTQGDDLIDLAAIDAVLPLTFLGHNAAFSGAAGDLRTRDNGTDTFVEIDTDGDLAAEFAIQVVGVVVFVAADFIL
jgi:Ca2+-binding RTX toxin-like protein